jgi:superfamily II DNA or RNA helicase
MNLETLSHEEIRHECAFPTTFEKGLTYFSENKIIELMKNSTTGVYEGEVAASSFGDSYHVAVEYDLKTFEVESMGCTCHDFHEYEGMCKHLVAVMLKIKSESHGLERTKPTSSSLRKPGNDPHMSLTSQRRAKRLMDSFEQIYMKKQEAFQEREPLNVEYTLHLQSAYSPRFLGMMSLELKIGPKRLYVVKDIPELLKAAEENEAVKFSKLFTYHPADYFFSKEDMSIFSLMAKITQLREDEKETPSYGYFKSVSEKKREFMIPPTYAGEVLALLQTRQVVLDDGLEVHHDITVTDEKPELAFHLTEADDEWTGAYRLSWEGSNYAHYFGKKYGFLYINGTFHRLKGDALEAFDTLFFQMVTEAPAELILDESQLETFASLVLPRLRELGHVSLTKSLNENIKMAPLQPLLYVDYVDERLTAEVFFQYGETKLSPFHREATDSSHVIVRDVEQEYFLLSIIENIPFKFNGSDLFLDDQAEILAFVAEDVPQLSKSFHLYISESVKNIVHQPVEAPSIKVETNESLSLLDVSFEVDGISDEELNGVLKSLLDQKKYYQLESGAYLHLDSDAFKHMKRVIEDLDMSAKDVSPHTSLPLYRAFQLSEETEVQIKKDRAFKKLVERLTEPEELDFPVPEHLDNVLRDYQKRGYQWLMSLAHYGFGGILADDMGLGKTLQTIAYLSSVKNTDQESAPAMIICPSSVVYNWQKELEKFAPDLSTVVISGSQHEREEALNSASGVDIWITSYPLIRRDIHYYDAHHFSTLVLDEAQYVKNQGTLTSKAVRMITSTNSFALSGTPIENSLDELYSIFSIVQPGIFKNKQTFKNYEESRIARRIKPFVLRRMKNDVLQELPDKIESIEYTHLSEQQKTVYLGQLHLLKSEASEVFQTNTFQENRMKLLAGLTRLRQICCHPGMFLDDYTGGSGKLERLLEYLEEARDAGKRIVLFSQFTQMLAIMKKHLNKSGWDYHYLDGSTPSNERVELAERFNRGEKDLFLVSLKAGGTGLNLTGGDTVILFDSWWNPAVEEQAADRVYRFGQKRIVHVTKMITTGTIEEKIHQLQEKKRHLLDRVIQPGETMMSSLGKEDIEELLGLS